MQTGQRISYHSISRLYLADVGDIEDGFRIVACIQRQIAADGEVAVHVDVAGGGNFEVAAGGDDAFAFVAVVNVHMAVFGVVGNGGDGNIARCLSRCIRWLSSIAEAVANVAHCVFRVRHTRSVRFRTPSRSHAVDTRHFYRLSIGRCQLPVNIHTAAADGNTAISRGNFPRVFVLILTPACSILHVPRGGDAAVDGDLPVRIDCDGGAVELRRAAEGHVTGNAMRISPSGVCLDSERAVAVDEAAEVAAAPGGHEIIQRETCTVHGKPCVVIDTEFLPIELQISFVTICFNNREERIVGRAVLDGIDAIQIRSNFVACTGYFIAGKIVLRIRQERIQNGRGPLVNTPVFSSLNDYTTAILRRESKRIFYVVLLIPILILIFSIDHIIFFIEINRFVGIVLLNGR